jgi:hypothetical protein
MAGPLLEFQRVLRRGKRLRRSPPAPISGGCLACGTSFRKEKKNNKIKEINLFLSFSFSPISAHERPIVCREGALDMIDMMTTALDVGIMTGIVLFVAFGLALRRGAPGHSGLHRDTTLSGL